MLPATSAWDFSVAALALILLPGPSVLFVIGRSPSLGRKGGVLSVVGNALCILPAITAVSLGVGAIVAESVVVFTVIKFVGAAYLVTSACRRFATVAITQGLLPPFRSGRRF